MWIIVDIKTNKTVAERQRYIELSKLYKKLDKKRYILKEKLEKNNDKI